MPNTLSPYRKAALEYALSSCSLFEGVDNSTLNALAQIAVFKYAGKGEHLFYQGAPSRGFYIIHTGLIRLYRVNLRGQEQVLHLARNAEAVAEETLFSDRGYLANAAAVERSTLLFLPKTEFLGHFRARPALAGPLLRSTSERMGQVVSLLDDLRLKDARTRLVSWLLDHCSKNGNGQEENISLSIPKALLASELGMCSETLSRLFAELQKKRLLQVRRKLLTIPSRAQLERLASSNVDDYPQNQTQSAAFETSDEHYSETVSLQGGM